MSFSPLGISLILATSASALSGMVLLIVAYLKKNQYLYWYLSMTAIIGYIFLGLALICGMILVFSKEKKKTKELQPNVQFFQNTQSLVPENNQRLEENKDVQDEPIIETINEKNIQSAINLKPALEAITQIQNRESLDKKTTNTNNKEKRVHPWIAGQDGSFETYFKRQQDALKVGLNDANSAESRINTMPIVKVMVNDITGQNPIEFYLPKHYINKTINTNSTVKHLKMLVRHCFKLGNPQNASSNFSLFLITKPDAASAKKKITILSDDTVLTHNLILENQYEMKLEYRIIGNKIYNHPSQEKTQRHSSSLKK